MAEAKGSPQTALCEGQKGRHSRKKDGRNLIFRASSPSPSDASRRAVEVGTILGSGRRFEAPNLNSEISKCFPY